MKHKGLLTSSVLKLIISSIMNHVIILYVKIHVYMSINVIINVIHDMKYFYSKVYYFTILILK